MGLSETILAAMIGAAATMLTALTQLMLTFRARMKAESRPKRNAMRSMMWMFALLVASAVGGFAYSELRAERAREDTRELRKELTDQLQALALSTAKLELLGGERAPIPALGSLASSAVGDQAVESVVHLSACRAGTPTFGNDPVSCAESDATHVELCADVPANATVTAIELYARSDASSEGWTEHGVTLDKDFGGGRFAASSFPYPLIADVRAVCTDLAHWNSDHGHVARMIVRYTLNPALSATQATVAARP